MDACQDGGEDCLFDEAKEKEEGGCQQREGGRGS